MKLRPYKKEDAAKILSWIKMKESLDYGVQIDIKIIRVNHLI